MFAFTPSLLLTFGYPLGMLLGGVLSIIIRSDKTGRVVSRFLRNRRTWFITGVAFTSLLAIGSYYGEHSNAHATAVEDTERVVYGQEIAYAEHGYLLPQSKLHERLAQTYGRGEGIYVAYRNTPIAADVSPVAILAVKNGEYILTTIGIGHRINADGSDTGTPLQVRAYASYVDAQYNSSELLPIEEPTLTNNINT